MAKQHSKEAASGKAGDYQTIWLRLPRRYVQKFDILCLMTGNSRAGYFRHMLHQEIQKQKELIATYYSWKGGSSA